MHELIVKYLRRKLSRGEKRLLQEWIEKHPKNKALFDELANMEFLKKELQVYHEAEKEKEVELQTLKKTTFGEASVISIKQYSTWKRYMVAASVLLALTIAAFIFLPVKNSDSSFANKATDQPLENDVAPGAFKARLTLSDGSVIVLDSATNGELVTQGETVVYSKEGRLDYKAGIKTSDAIIYNTLTTARGETYTVTLSDGSRVWLNAASRIKFPVVFTGDERNIEISGQAFFEVRADKTSPFTVSVNGMEVTALGTQFDVLAYSDEEAMKVTLIEGSVRVKKADNASILQPGQQAIVKNADIKLISDININEVIAWKNQDFYFRSTGLREVMRQLARWYDIEVVYKDGLPNQTFTGAISRNRSLSQVLQMLETNNVRFSIEGKIITVMP